MKIEMTEDELDEYAGEWLTTPDGQGLPVLSDGLTERNVWTIVEGDEGDLYAMAGLHFVNRLGYAVSANPWEDEAQYGMWMANEEVD